MWGIQYDSGPYKGGIWTHTHTHTHTGIPCEDQSYAATIHNPRTRKDAWNRFSPAAFRGSVALLTH